MKEILETLYYADNRRKLYHIIDYPGLLNWIDSMCNQDLLDETHPQKNLLHIKIQTILNPFQPVRCVNGRWLQYNVPAKKFHCIRECDCWLAQANKKHRESMINMYGYEHSFQSPVTKDKIKKTMQEKYGVDHVSQMQTVKETKADKSMERYGVSNVLQALEVREKIKNTLLERYGVTASAHIDYIQDKKEQTCFEKYGERVLARIPGVQDQRAQTCLERYGASCMFETPNFQKSTEDIRKKNNNNRYGVDHPRKLVMTEYARSIIYSPELLRDMLISDGFGGVKKKLQVANSTVYKYHKIHGLNLLNPFGSYAEKEISDWLSAMQIGHVLHDRTICRPKELDIYIPDHKLALEFDGLYWHSEEAGKDKSYHIDKTHECNKQEIELIHIFEDEWINNKDICKSIISGKLGLIANKIPARKCKVREIDNRTLQPFLDSNHLQGHTHGSINLALYYNDAIVSAMTFGRPRYNKNVQWELLRLATKINTYVVGGMQKLWSYFQKTYVPSSIVSYCDKRWFSGDIYSSLGFIKKNKAIPTYWYTDCEHRYHRSRFTKKKVVKYALEIPNNMLTEAQLNTMTEKQITSDILDLLRIWDCGQDTWIWKQLR